MKLLISTGIFPPEIGGPAQYAMNLRDEFRRQGFKVQVATFGYEKKLPTGIRHGAFFFKALWHAATSDRIILLDTFSVALPTIAAARIFNKPVIVRIGGDFLWESYVERSHQRIPLNAFYKENTHFPALTYKEKAIFKITRHVLKHCAFYAFTTEWQLELWKEPYALQAAKSKIVTNFMGKKLPSFEPERKIFLWAGRPIFLKNISMLKEAFEAAQEIDSSIALECIQAPQEVLQAKIAQCYAVIVPSLSEVSPNLILDALRHSKPFIVTKHNGLSAQLEGCGISIDPLDKNDIKDKILLLANEDAYAKERKKVEQFSRTHSWQEIADEYKSLFTTL